MINCGKKRRLNKHRKFNALYINVSDPASVSYNDRKVLKKMLQNSKRNDHKPITHFNGIEIQGPELLSDIIGYDKSKAIELTGEPLIMADCELPVWKDDNHKIEAGGIMSGEDLWDFLRPPPVLTPSLEYLCDNGELIKLPED